METWPKEFRLPEWDNYGVSVDPVLVRTAFDTGYARQRKKSFLTPEQYSVTLVCPYWQWGQIQRWIRDIGYNWFLMPMVNAVSSLTSDERCKEQIVRFTSGLEIATRGRDYVEIKTTMELHPENFLEAGYADTGVIFAGSPDDAATEVIIAKDPADPADPDRVIAGDPKKPSGHA